jgi:hypothetical protein
MLNKMKTLINKKDMLNETDVNQVVWLFTNAIKACADNLFLKKPFKAVGNQ